MIKSRLVHPQMLQALAAAGHGSTVLITDGHYAAKTAVGSNACTVYLNLAPDQPTVTAVLEVVVGVVVVEKVTRIRPSPDAVPCLVHEEIDRLLPEGIEQEFLGRSDFYERARSENLALCVVTGDTRRFANALLTVGVLRDPVIADRQP